MSVPEKVLNITATRMNGNQSNIVEYKVSYMIDKYLTQFSSYDMTEVFVSCKCLNIWEEICAVKLYITPIGEP